MGLVAVSLAATALADNGKDNKGKNDEQKSEQKENNGKSINASSVYRACRKDAQTALNTAEKASKDVLNTAKKNAKQVRKNAITAANGNLAQIDTANANYRTAITVAMNIQRIASDAAQTAYDSAITRCKTNQLAAVTPTPTPTATPVGYTMATVATHNTLGNCWTVISGNVYNVTGYVNYPGGTAGLALLCGVNGTTAFNAQSGHSISLLNNAFYIGVLQ